MKERTGCVDSYHVVKANVNGRSKQKTFEGRTIRFVLIGLQKLVSHWCSRVSKIYLGLIFGVQPIVVVADSVKKMSWAKFWC